jgi:hypothetical protein
LTTGSAPAAWRASSTGFSKTIGNQSSNRTLPLSPDFGDDQGRMQETANEKKGTADHLGS